MDRAAIVAAPHNQATAPAHILRIIFNEFSTLKNGPNLLRGDHAIRPRHLADCVWQEQQPLRKRRSHAPQDFQLFWHARNLTFPALSSKIKLAMLLVSPPAAPDFPNGC